MRFDGNPFIIIGQKSLDCIHGVDHKVSRKKKVLTKRVEDNKNPDSMMTFQKSRFLNQDSKKMNCSAKIVIRDVVKFMNFKAEGDKKYHKQKVKTSLKKAWVSDKENVKFERFFLVQFPTEDCHSDHFKGEEKGSGLTQTVDKQIIEKMNQLVGEGVRSVREMQRHLKVYLKNDLFLNRELPDTSSRKYYPLKSDIRNHMDMAAVKLRLSKIDQENLRLTTNKWQKESPDDLFFFRGYGEVVEQSVDAGNNNDNDEVKLKPLPTKQKHFCIKVSIRKNY